MLHVGSLSSVPRGEALRIDAVSPPVVVFRTEDDEVFAVDDTCTHQDASLADGWLEGCAVECPLHASSFDLRTGEVDQPPARRPIRVHEVTLDGEEIYLTLSDAAPNLPPGVTA